MTDIEKLESEPALVPVLDRAPVRADSPTFAELGVRAETVEALASAGITRAFAIQEYALPIALRGTDMIGQAPTGTGKTLAFGLPLLERVLAPSEGSDGQAQALVVVPTRELGLQVARDIAAAGASRGVRVLPIYGGVAYEPQVDQLKKGVEILVGTPGRLLDLAKQKQLKLGSIKALVLDEADRMLDLGFLEDVERILAMLPEQRQTMLFSATMPDPIVALSRRFLHHPVTIHAGHTTDSGPSPLTKQVVYRTHPLNKLEMVARILQARDRGLTMIFTRTKRAADRVAEDLDFRGFAVAAVHGDLGQGARERALRAFRTGKVDVLVATDVAARGLDVSGVTHVLNYDCPEDPDTYTHRIGRTGRAGATGVAVTFVDWEDMPRWVLIDKSMGLSMPQPPETYHTSPALYADLDIPEGISGTLPTAGRTRVGLSAEVEEDLGGPSRSRSRSGGRDGGRSPAGGGGRGRSGGRSGGGRDDRPADRTSDRPSDRGPARNDAAPAAVGSPDETSDRPRRQRRRRKPADAVEGMVEGQTLSGTDTAPSPIDDTTAEAGTRDNALADDGAPARSRTGRRRSTAGRTQAPDAVTPLFSDGTGSAPLGAGGTDFIEGGDATDEYDSAPTNSDAAAGSEPGSEADEAERKRRRRRRGGRGGRGAANASDGDTPGADAPEMTGGSEAGVGTTSEA
jgi:superfamily II DNA/RNA helicase